MDAAHRQAVWEEGESRDGERKGGDVGVSLLLPLATFDPTSSTAPSRACILKAQK